MKPFNRSVKNLTSQPHFNMSEVKNIPRLRFTEFSENWTFQNIKSLSQRIGDGLHGTPKYVEDTDYFFINGNNLEGGTICINSKIKKVSEIDYEKNNKGLNEKSLLISLNGTIGNISKYNNEKVMLGKSVGYINFTQQPDFYYFQLKTSKIQNHFISELTGSTIKNLSLKTLRNTKLSIPSLPEQQKIADFLTAVDKRIKLLEKKKTLLETYKKGVMKKIFNQEIRFKDNNGNDFPNWEKNRLEDVFNFFRGSSLSKSDLDVNGSFKCIHYGELFTKYNEIIKNITSKTNKEGNRSNVGDILMPTSDVTPFGLATASCIEEKDVILGGDMNILRGKLDIDSKFYSYLLNYSVKSIIKLVTGTTIKHIYSKDLKTLLFNVPKLQEQNKISQFLISIDTQIELLETQIDKSKTWKKGLLQKMFV